MVLENMFDSCYRPPTSGTGDVLFEYLREILKEVDKEEKETYIIVFR